MVGRLNRTDVLNHLADTYRLGRYLEIGVQNPAQNFDKIRCAYKVSVDPDPGAKASFCMTSDEFFKDGFPRLFVNSSWETKFDLIFIDGLHQADQVRKDFSNACKELSPHGFIVLHDCNPMEQQHTIVPRPSARGHWNGDCYKVACEINQAIKFTVDVDNGCCVVRPSRGNFLFSAVHQIDWTLFSKHRKDLLNLITWDEFTRRTLPHVQ